MKNHFLCPSRVLLFLSPVFLCFFLLFIFSFFLIFCSFLHFLNFSMFFNFLFHFFRRKSFFFSFFLYFFQIFLLLAKVSEFNCFLRSRCSMEMWCPDDIGWDSWDWVGPPAWGEHASTPQSGVEAPRLLKWSLTRLYYCCCCCCCCCCCLLLFLLFFCCFLLFFVVVCCCFVVVCCFFCCFLLFFCCFLLFFVVFCMTPVHCFCCAQCNLVTLGIRLPIQPSAVGNRSSMWSYHITGTPGCSTPKVHNQHSLG